MAILKLEELETREDALAKAFTSDMPRPLNGIKFVRKISPLVVVALNKANNPYLTGKRGFEALGLTMEGDSVSTPAEIGVAIMPKTAEVIVLLTCGRDDLKRYAEDSKALQSAALDMLEDHDVDFFAKATELISEELGGVSKTQAAEAPEEEKIKPAGGEGAGIEKKPVLVG